MTPQEALEGIDSWCVGCTQYKDNCELCEYPVICNALEKQIPKKPIDRYRVKAFCPNCGGGVTLFHDWCFRCGQSIDWSDDK